MLKLTMISIIAISLGACKSSRGRVEVEAPPTNVNETLAPSAIDQGGVPVTNNDANLDLLLFLVPQAEYDANKVIVQVEPIEFNTLPNFSGNLTELRNTMFPSGQAYRINVAVDIGEGEAPAKYSSADCDNSEQYMFLSGLNSQTIRLCTSSTSSVTITPQIGPPPSDDDDSEADSQ